LFIFVIATKTNQKMLVSVNSLRSDSTGTGHPPHKMVRISFDAFNLD